MIFWISWCFKLIDVQAHPTSGRHRGQIHLERNACHLLNILLHRQIPIDENQTRTSKIYLINPIWHLKTSFHKSFWMQNVHFLPDGRSEEAWVEERLTIELHKPENSIAKTRKFNQNTIIRHTVLRNCPINFFIHYPTNIKRGIL